MKNEPTLEEVNRGIAEFMGWRRHPQLDPDGFEEWIWYNSRTKEECVMLDASLPRPLRYTESLDALAYVWEKLNNEDLSLSYCNDEWSCSYTDADYGITHDYVYSIEAETAAEAAARATYAAIQDIQKQNNEEG